MSEAFGGKLSKKVFQGIRYRFRFSIGYHSKSILKTLHYLFKLLLRTRRKHHAQKHLSVQKVLMERKRLHPSGVMQKRRRPPFSNLTPLWTHASLATFTVVAVISTITSLITVSPTPQRVSTENQRVLLLLTLKMGTGLWL